MVHFGDSVLVFCALWTVILPLSAVRTELTGVNPSTATATQDVFQAEEGSNVTLTCLFHLKTHTPATSLYIDIISENLKRSIYRYYSEYEPELYEDELYRGRVLCDLELLKKGRIECLFTDLRLSDTSAYIFIVVINRVSHRTRCGLKVTETPPHPTINVRTPGSDETDVKGDRLRLIILVPVLVLVLIMGGGVAGYLLKHVSKTKSFRSMTSPQPNLFQSR